MFVSLAANAQLTVEKGIEINILSDSIISSARDLTATVSLKCTNFSAENILLYGFDSEPNSFTDIDRICNVDRVSARFALFISDANGKIYWPEWHIGKDIDYKPMPIERLESSMEQIKLRYLTEMKVIKTREVLIVEKEIDLASFHLKAGTYYLQYGYYSGKGVEQAMVGKLRIEDDCKRYSARLYQGCALSNRIVLQID